MSFFILKHKSIENKIIVINPQRIYFPKKFNLHSYVDVCSHFACERPIFFGSFFSGSVQQVAWAGCRCCHIKDWQAPSLFTYRKVAHPVSHSVN